MCKIKSRKDMFYTYIESGKMELGKGIIQVILANIINLIISIGNGFLLPKYLPVESYANIKTFILYTSYVGVLPLGYIDGIYIKYGGRIKGEIEAEEFVREKKVLTIFQLVVSLPIVLMAFFLGDLNVLFVAISILPINMVSFFRLVYQATGEFKEYRYITNLSSALIFALNLFFLFVIKTDISMWYIGIQVIVSFFVWIYYENKNRIASVSNKISLKEMRAILNENIHLGIIIMLGSFMGVWITSIDRWFVKFLYSVADFAYYSFAVTMLRLVNVVVTAFSVTLYNFFCRKPKYEEIIRLRKIVLVVGASVIVIVFPLDFFIQIYLKKYIYAVPIIRMLFMAQFILIEVNAVYLNLYKALNLQRKYLTRMVMIAIVAFLSNVVIGYFWSDNIMAYAVATLFTALVWLILCQVDLSQYKMSYREWLYILLIMTAYFVCSYSNIWIGMVIYICLTLLGTFLVFMKDIKLLFEIVLEKIRCR